MEIRGSEEMKDGMQNEWENMIRRRELESGLGGEMGGGGGLGE